MKNDTNENQNTADINSLYNCKPHKASEDFESSQLPKDEEESIINLR